MLNVIMLNVIMLNVTNKPFILSVIMLNVILLSAVANLISPGAGTITLQIRNVQKVDKFRSKLVRSCYFQSRPLA
jgi:hypothetical protein